MTADAKPADGLNSLLQSPGELLDLIVEQLSKVGIDLPPAAIQIFLLVLVLIALGVLLGLVDNLTMPRRVSGQVASDRPAYYSPLRPPADEGPVTA